MNGLWVKDLDTKKLNAVAYKSVLIGSDNNYYLIEVIVMKGLEANEFGKDNTND